MRRLICLFLSLCITAMAAGCTGKVKEPENLTGTLDEIMSRMYENAELTQDFRDSMQYFEQSEIAPEDAEYVIGTSDLNYEEALFSAPMMNAVAYQCILLRMSEGADMEASKEAILKNADPRKWICVEAESTVVENVGDIILFVMAEEEIASALRTSFLQMK